MGRSLAAFVFATGLCLAQAPLPDEAPLDLEALAAQLDPGEEPSLEGLIPVNVVEWLRERAKPLTATEAREIWDDANDPLFGALACRVAAGGRDAASEPQRLLRELKACGWFEAAVRSKGAAAILDVDDDLPAWRYELGKAAAPRWRWLAAKILREHGDSSVVADVLSSLAHKPGALDMEVTPQRLSRESIRRRGSAVDRTDWLRHAEVCLRALDLDAASAASAAAAAARSSRTATQQRKDATRAFHLRQRLARVSDAAGGLEAEGAAGRLAQLRLHLRCDLDAAIETATRLQADGDESALALAILAFAAWFEGRSEDAEALLARSLAAPGLDIDVAAVLMAVRGLRTLRRVGKLGFDDVGVRDEVATLRRDLDRCLADDSSEPAEVMRWLLDAGVLVPTGEPELDRLLPSAVALQQRLPDSHEAYCILLGCALDATDGELAREALLRPIPAALVGLPDVALLRAKAFVLTELRADRPTDSPELARVLADLREIDGCDRDVAFLRGVCEWWEALRPGGEEEHRRAARTEFAGRRWGPSDAVWAPAATALFVAEASLGRAVDWNEPLRVLELRHRGDRVPAYVPYWSQVFVSPSLPLDKLRALEASMGEVSHEASQAVVRAAIASAWSRHGEAAAARDNAAAALAAIEQRSSFHLPHDRGVLVAAGLRWNVSFSTGGARIDIRTPLDFWIVPPVPGVDELKRLAGRAAPK